jgi:hypothetical protein
MTTRIRIAAVFLAAMFPAWAAAGAMDECNDAGGRDAVAKCLTTLDSDTLAQLKTVETLLDALRATSKSRPSVPALTRRSVRRRGHSPSTSRRNAITFAWCSLMPAHRRPTRRAPPISRASPAGSTLRASASRL